MREYLTSVDACHNWFLITESIKVGDLVLSIEPDLLRRHWKNQKNRLRVSRSRWIRRSSRGEPRL